MNPGTSKTKQAKTERQGHGLEFEDWLSDTFFASSYPSGVTDHWDFRGVVFKPEFAGKTSVFSGLPISVKTCKERKSISLGDAVRQFDNGQDFLLIVAFWRQSGSSKQVASVVALKVDKAVWHDLFGGMTRQELSDFDKFVKDKTNDRKAVQKEKKKLPASDMTINPKVGSQVRRVQCSISYTKFWSVLAGSTAKSSFLWGEQVPNLQ